MINNYTSEITALANAFVSREKLNKISQLEDEDFYDNKCKNTFIVIKELYNLGKEVDFINVKNKLIDKNIELDDKFYTEIITTPFIIDIDGLIKTLRKYTQKRKILNIEKRLTDFKNNKISNEKIINDLYNDLEIIERSKTDRFKNVSDLCTKDPDNFKLDKDSYIETGFYDLDKIIFGLINSEFTIIGARTGLGKSSIAMNIAMNIAKQKKVLYISLEMLADLLTIRMLSSWSGVDSYYIRRGELSEKDIEKIFNASKKIYSLNMSIIDNAFDLNTILSDIRKFHAYYKDIVVFIDYIQKIRVPGIEQKRLQIAEISGMLKQFCNSLNIPIVALAQLSRNAEGNAPRLSDLKEAGDLEQDADNVIFLHNTLEMGNVYDILVAKGRSCGTGNFQLIFDKKTTTFRNKERDFNNVFGE